MKTEITKKAFKKTIIFKVLEWVLCYGLLLVYIIIFLAGKAPTEDGLTFEQKFGTLLTTLGATLLPMIILSIIVKDKIRPCIWMINIIASNYLLGNTAMYTTFAIWVIDTYGIANIAKLYMNRYQINREIDRRIADDQ